MTKKHIILILSYFIIWLIGLFVGAYIAIQSENYFSENSLKDLAKHNDYAYKQYRNKILPDAKLGMLKHTLLLDEAIESNETLITSHRLDKVLTLGRLALIAEWDKDQIEMKKYFEQAIGVCKELNREDCSENNIRKMLEQIDQGQGASLNMTDR